MLDIITFDESEFVMDQLYDEQELLMEQIKQHKNNCKQKTKLQLQLQEVEKDLYDLHNEFDHQVFQ